jgi:hypothetical protein
VGVPHCQLSCPWQAEVARGSEDDVGWSWKAAAGARDGPCTAERD